MASCTPLLLRFRWLSATIAARSASCLACVLLLGAAVYGLDPNKSSKAPLQPAQYVATVWQAEQGLPQNSVTAMLQDHQGYLWVGTFGGLARFDGDRFTLFESRELLPLGNNGVLSMYETRSGVLWIGTLDGGLIRLDNGVATTYTERDGLPSRFVSSIREDREGKLWFNTSEGVAHFVATKLEAFPAYRGRAVREFLLQARDGSMWFRYGEDVVRFGTDGSIANLKSPKPTSFLVHEARDGSVWIAFRDRYRLVRYYRGIFSDVPLPPIPGELRRKNLPGDYLVYTLSMAEDAEGKLLLLTPAGLCRIADGSLGPPEAVPLPSNGRELLKVRGLLVDREGNVWVGTNGLGLVRLRRAPLIAYGKDEGLSDAGFNAVFQDREGRIWLGGDSLYWFDGHQFHLFPGVANVRAIAQTRDGDLWFAGYGGLHRYSSGVLSDFKLGAPDVRAIHQDREGTLWIGALMEEHPGGLYRFHEGKLDQIPGISDVNQIIEDRDGGLWVGGVKELIYMHGGKTVRYDQKQGLPERSVDLHQDSAGTLWIASYGGGLTRLRGGRLTVITTKDGLPNNMLAGMLEDRQGNLWISSTQNIFRLSLKELNDLADGRISAILPVSYGVAEGMRSSESDVGSPAGLETNDGRIWFPTMRGVIAIDPNAGNRVPPPVVIEEAWANKFALATEGRTSTPPGNNTFDFRFTALSFSAPNKLRFRYRLEPFEKDWVDAGARRTAHYTNMDPGEYSFHVLAANNFGIWSDHEASVRFVLRPHFYQTNWFRALCVVFFTAFAWAAFRLRIRQLQRESKKLRDVIETIPAIVFEVGPDGSGASANRRWLEYTGSPLRQYGRFAPEDQAWRDSTCLHPDDVDGYVKLWERAIATGQPFELETRVRRADGEYRLFLARHVPLRDQYGRILKWFGTFTDIDERKRAEEALRESETRFRTFVDHAGDALFVYDLEQRIVVDVNRSACESLDYTRQELIGKTPFAFHLDSYQAEMESIAERAVAGETVIDRHWHRRKDGSLFPVEVHTTLILYGGRRFLLMVARDISERLRAEEQRDKLRQLEADLAHINRVSMLGELAASLAHELNQPITGAITSAGACMRWLAHDPPDLERARAATMRVEKDGTRAAEIIKRLRAFYKKGAPPKRESVNVHEVVNEIIVLLRDEANRHSITIREELAPDLHTVLADRVQLQQVFMNLMLNAIEAMKNGGELTVRSQRTENQMLLLSISDTGVGLPTEKADQIFNAFFTTKLQGTGMGLKITRSIIEAHGGRMWASNNAERGATFYFTLPADAGAMNERSTVADGLHH